MARRPDVVCAGGCGERLWSGTGSLPPGKAKCRKCRAAARARRRALAQPDVVLPPRPLSTRPPS